MLYISRKYMVQAVPFPDGNTYAVKEPGEKLVEMSAEEFHAKYERLIAQ